MTQGDATTPPRHAPKTTLRYASPPVPAPLPDETLTADPNAGESGRAKSASDATIASSTITKAMSALASGMSGAPPSLTTRSPLEAFYFEEFTRTRLFIKVVWGLAVVVLASFPFVGGDPAVKKLMAAATVANALFAGWLWRDLRDASRFSTAKVTAFCVACALTGFVAVVFWGVFSAAPVLVVLGVYYFGRSYSTTAALVNYLVAAVTQAVWSALVIGGVVHDYGLFDGRGRPTLELATAQMMVQGVYLLGYLSARSSRKATLEVLERLEAAVRQSKQREAFLEEVRQDLNRALAPGQGRYSDQEIGSYKLGAVLGRGGMGEVYAAVHVSTGDDAAVKLLHAHLEGDVEHGARFLREARAASALASPHVVRVLETAAEGARPLYIAMERLHGETLAARLRDRRKLTPSEVMDLVRQIGSVIDLAAEKSIVHRDLKPQNLFLSKAGEWKVLDFGVSSLGGSGTLTAGQIIGTPGYMSPEQARGERVDASTDVYALAVIAYRALTGRPAFSGKDTPAILYDVVFSMPPRPSELSDLPRAVDDVLLVAMAKRSSDRFSSGAALAGALADAARGEVSAAIASRARSLTAAHPWG